MRYRKKHRTKKTRQQRLRREGRLRNEDVVPGTKAVIAATKKGCIEEYIDAMTFRFGGEW